jgi:hypothetical protein
MIDRIGVSLVRMGLGMFFAVTLVGCGDDDDGDALRLNQMQVLGSHNSYHIQPMEPLFSLIAEVDPAIALGFEYTHLPLDTQFDTHGIRQIELDIFHDPEGGLYSSPIGLQIAAGDPMATIPGLDLPGFKVFHVQEIDFETRCKTLIECLEIVKDWSDAHPHHVPITILIEAKDDAIPDPIDLGFLVPPEIGAAELDLLDEEILSVFPRGQLILPDDVRGNRDTLEKAVVNDGWPTLESARGKILFALDNGGSKKAAYIDGHPSLRGRVLFTSSLPGEPEAAFAKLNNPIGDFDLIQELVADGFIVRTRADGDTIEARTGDTMQRDAALGSGAQFVSTDYPVPNPDFGTDYQVSIPGGMPARCNPINAPPSCRATDIEDPERLD